MILECYRTNSNFHQPVYMDNPPKRNHVKTILKKSFKGKLIIFGCASIQKILIKNRIPKNPVINL